MKLRVDVYSDYTPGVPIYTELADKVSPDVYWRLRHCLERFHHAEVIGTVTGKDVRSIQVRVTGRRDPVIRRLSELFAFARKVQTTS